jgi:hypothetical protein
MDGPKVGCNDPDSRGIKTQDNLVKNKLRAMGLKMSYEPEGELVDENSTSIKMSLEDYMMVKKDGSRVRMPGDPPKVKKELGGYDYTPTKEQQAAMKKPPKTKIGSRFD